MRIDSSFLFVLSLVISCADPSRETQSLSQACSFEPAFVEARLGQAVHVKMVIREGTPPYVFESIGYTQTFSSPSYLPDSSGGMTIVDHPILISSFPDGAIRDGYSLARGYNVDPNNSRITQAEKEYLARYPGRLVEDAELRDSRGKTILCGPLKVQLRP